MQLLFLSCAQMTASNLAVCFAPSLFNFVGSLTNSPRRQRKNPGIPEQHELLEQKAVHECFTFMITNCKKLFMVNEFLDSVIFFKEILPLYQQNLKL